MLKRRKTARSMEDLCADEGIDVDVGEDSTAGGRAGRAVRNERQSTRGEVGRLKVECGLVSAGSGERDGSGG